MLRLSYSRPGLTSAKNNDRTIDVVPNSLCSEAMIAVSAWCWERAGYTRPFDRIELDSVRMNDIRACPRSSPLYWCI